MPEVTGFHQDHEGWWVVELSCGHAEHVRHRPPWELRAWVLTAEGRAGMLGRAWPCGACAKG